MEYNSIVMVPVKDLLWVPTRVQKCDGLTCVVQTEKGDQLSFPVKEVKLVHEKTVSSSDDMTKLDELHESVIINNIRQRFFAGDIYTYIGPVIISVNPYRKIESLGPQLIPSYQTTPRENLAPHLYAISQSAYESMIHFGMSQSIIIIGESGAGKTEATKIVLRFLTESSEKNPLSHFDIEKKIIATNPLLEAFGNAKTVKNSNSSRFGKFIKVLFQGRKIEGASIDNYLLEKTRVVHQATNERNYHIFYQFIKGTTPKEREKYSILDSEQQYKYLTNGSVPIPKDDPKDWEETLKAFRVLGFNEEEIDAVMRLLSAILRLGNMDFVSKSETSCQIKNESTLEIFCSLLGLTEKLGIARKSFTSRSVQTKNSVTYIPLNLLQAEANRDALAKKLYNELFNWLVTKLNKQLKKNDTPVNDLTFVGVLDIYGFEIFEQNSLEQFCINYANEKLHSQFTEFMFRAEQKEYLEEGVPWSEVSFRDNGGCVSLIEKKKGIIDFIQEQCKLRDCSDEGLLREMKKNIRNVWFDEGHPSDPQDQFKIKHFAGTVTYSTVGFIEKNKDTLNTDLEMLMKGSKHILVPSFFEEIEEEQQTDPSPRGVLSASFSTGSGSVSGSGGGGSGNSLELPLSWPSMESPHRSSPFHSPRQSFSSMTSPRTPRTSNIGGRVVPVARDKKTVSVRFREELNKLIDTLSASSKHYVRCVKPNELQTPDTFNSQKVMDQLKCNGIFETVAIRKSGFSVRMLHDRFYDKFWSLMSGTDTLTAIKSMLQRLIPDASRQWYIGKTKVFLSDTALYKLTSHLTALWKDKAIPIQSHIRRYLVQTSYQHALAVRAVQSFVRRYVVQSSYLHLLAVLKVQALVRRHDVQVLYQQSLAARTLQCFVRRRHATAILEDLIVLARGAVVCERMVRRYNACEALRILKEEHEALVRACVVAQKYVRGLRAFDVLTELSRKLTARKKRASTYNNYVEYTTVGEFTNSPAVVSSVAAKARMNKRERIPSNSYYQQWTREVDTDQDNVILIVVNNNG